MNAIDIIKNRKSFIKDDILGKEVFYIDNDDIMYNELELLEHDWYNVLLFNQKWIKKPYYRIWK